MKDLLPPSLSLLISDLRAVAAVEMALVAPFLIFGLLMMLDIGMAVREGLNLDHSTRVGAQAVMSNINEANDISNLILASANEPDKVTIAVEKTCSCDGLAVDCANWCSAKEPPSVFLNISAVKLHKGFLLPPFNLESETHVQIR
ncbi:TadE/TadG family type IV pilus assembly protein [Labrenzia sp. VG12]|uniref:TadE/TadG family type IV pilus assembly protein n=1 Tax=Labrenzia sp. VG12 TaxID=2021862 RepID=UPI0012FD43AA|nr:TadE family protein [Labrenzia sp. VG12]